MNIPPPDHGATTLCDPTSHAGDARPDQLTVIAARKPLLLTKIVRADGSVIPYSNAKIFDLLEVNVFGLDTLSKLLERVAIHPRCAVIRGAAADPARTKGVRRLLHHDRETGDTPTIKETPRSWICVDIDDLERPPWIEPTDLIGCAIVATRVLPEAFRGVRCIAHATSSHGIKPGIRLHLWFWLSRSISTAEATYWFRNASVDPASFRPSQIVYTANPIFAGGAVDPLPHRLAEIPGEEHVRVPPPGHLRWPRFRDPDIDVGDWLGGLTRVVEAATPGNRNQALYWAARRAAEHSATWREAELLIDAACSVGLTPNEARATVESGLRHD